VRSFISGSLFVVVVVGTVVNSVEVRGEDASAGAREATAQARQAYDAGRMKEALEGYKRAYELSGDVSMLFLLGEISRALGDDVAAVRFYRSYIGRDPRGKQREAADRAARELEKKLARPSPAWAPATPIAAPSPPAATPPAQSPPGRRPAAPVPTVDLSAAPTPAASAASGPPLPRWLPWFSLGATLALGTGAVVTGLGASQRYDELRGSCGQTSEGCAQTDIDQVKSRALIANLLWAAAGVGAITTGVTLYVNTREAGFAGVWSF
jgi:tetratricopeptide (TPR) repeat protein